MEAIKTVLAVPYKQMYADSLDDATIQGKNFIYLIIYASNLDVVRDM